MLSSRRHLTHPRHDVAARLDRILRIPSFHVTPTRIHREALDIWATHSALDYEFAVTVAYTRSGHHELASFDPDFDDLPDLVRFTFGDLPETTS